MIASGVGARARDGPLSLAANTICISTCCLRLCESCKERAAWSPCELQHCHARGYLGRIRDSTQKNPKEVISAFQGQRGWYSNETKGNARFMLNVAPRLQNPTSRQPRPRQFALGRCSFGHLRGQAEIATRVPRPRVCILTAMAIYFCSICLRSRMTHSHEGSRLEFTQSLLDVCNCAQSCALRIDLAQEILAVLRTTASFLCCSRIQTFTGHAN
jgi:hypothetical protein